MAGVPPPSGRVPARISRRPASRRASRQRCVRLRRSSSPFSLSGLGGEGGTDRLRHRGRFAGRVRVQPARSVRQHGQGGLAVPVVVVLVGRRRTAQLARYPARVKLGHQRVPDRARCRISVSNAAISSSNSSRNSMARSAAPNCSRAAARWLSASPTDDCRTHVESSSFAYRSTENPQVQQDNSCAYPCSNRVTHPTAEPPLGKQRPSSPDRHRARSSMR